MSNKYPSSEGKLQSGSRLSVDCLTCRHRAVLDVAELVKLFGPDQPCLHWNLLKVIYCHECRAAGRDDRNLQFTNHALTPEKRKGSTPCP
jgi:hypothetical protein